MSARPPNTDDESHVETSSAVEPDDPPVGAIAVGGTEALISSEGEIRSGKLAGKSMWAAIWILALPVLLQQTMAACVGLADKIMAGGLPDQIVVAALDGLGIGAYVGWFIGIAMTGLGIGGQALIARANGAGDVTLLERGAVRQIYAELSPFAALYSPNSGILSADAFMHQLAGEFQAGDHVVVDAGESGLVLTKGAAVPQPA